MTTVSFTFANDTILAEHIAATNTLHPQDTPEGQEPLTPEQACNQYWMNAMLRDIDAYRRRTAEKTAVKVAPTEITAKVTVEKIVS